MESSRNFLALIASKCRQSARALLLAEEVVVTEVDEDLIPKFDAEDEEKAYLATLKHWEKKLHHSTIEDYTKFSYVIQKDLTTIHGILFKLCDVGLQNRIKAEPEYQAMVKRNRFYTLKLWKLIEKICNGSTAAVVEDVIGNMIEALFNFFLAHGEEYDALSRCLQAYEYKFDVLSGAGFDIAHNSLRDMHINELQSREQNNSEVYKALVG